METPIKKEDEEETLGQLRDRLRLTPGLARVPAPGRRAAFVHIKVEDSSSGEDTDGEGGKEEATGGEGNGEEEVEKEVEEGGDDDEVDDDEEEEPRDLRAHALGASIKGGGEAVHPQSLPPGARSVPGSPLARQRAPGRRVADNAVKDNDDVEEGGGVPELVMCSGAGASRFTGVSWDKNAAKWKAKCKGAYLGLHSTEDAAASAYNKYLEDGIDPVKHQEAGTSQLKGVCWNKRDNKWEARCKGMNLGYHATEEDAARTCSRYLKDGIDPVKHREDGTSHFTSVTWNKREHEWEARCKGKYLGCHTTEEAAARAYSVEAERVGRPLNVILPAEAAAAGAGPKHVSPGAGGGAGSKRAAPKTPDAPATNKKTKRAAPTTSAAPAPSKKSKL